MPAFYVPVEILVEGDTPAACEIKVRAWLEGGAFPSTDPEFLTFSVSRPQEDVETCGECGADVTHDRGVISRSHERSCSAYDHEEG